MAQSVLAGAGPAGPQADAISLPPAEPGNGGTPTREVLQQLMWARAGIVRDGAGLAQARATLAAWEHALPGPHDRDSYELANLVLAGRLVVEAALARKESRGAHYRADFPQTSPDGVRHTVFRAAAAAAGARAGALVHAA